MRTVSKIFPDMGWGTITVLKPRELYIYTTTTQVGTIVQ